MIFHFEANLVEWGDSMTVLVVGLGSMGKRRIRLMKEMYPEVLICGVDSREDRRIDASNMYGIGCFSSISEAKCKIDIDCSFVCTAPLSHDLIIEECLNNKWNVFTELNLVSDGYEKNIELAKKNGVVLFLSSTFFYREEISYLRKKIRTSNKWNYIYHIGQYLPDWHPWETYKEFFVGDRRTNGCREIMAIELPWLCSAFGEIVNSCVMADKMTDLKIDFNDNFIIQLQHENGNKGVLVVDVVSPCAVRRLEAYGENKYLQWSGTPESLMEFDSDEGKLCSVDLDEQTEHQFGYREFVVENAYKNEIREFFDVVYKRKLPIYGFEQDLRILQVIDSLEAKV